MRIRFELCLVLVLALVLPACASTPSPVTSTPERPTPTAAAPTVTPAASSTPSPAASPTASATVRATTAATAPASEPPSGVVALYAAGPQEGPQLYALSADGSPTEAEPETVYPGAKVSASGRWLASPSNFLPAEWVVIRDLGDETTYTIPATEGWGVYGMAFDMDGTRLAFLEMAAAQVQDIPWAIVVVRLQDGSITRFEGTTRADDSFLPGNPLGWVSSGSELLLNRFLPYSDGLYAGVWAVEIPLDAPSAPLDDLNWREVIPGGRYLSLPDISPDGTRLVYLARDRNYMPADYEPALDFAVNQLWSLDIAQPEPTMLYAVTQGDALASSAAWSPDGRRILFAQGHYAGMNWGSLGLQVYDEAGNIQGVAQLPLSGKSFGLLVNWCTPDMALALLSTGASMDELYTVGMEEGNPNLVASGGATFVLGCVAE